MSEGRTLRIFSESSDFRVHKNEDFGERVSPFQIVAYLQDFQIAIRESRARAGRIKLAARGLHRSSPNAYPFAIPVRAHSPPDRVASSVLSAPSRDKAHKMWSVLTFPAVTGTGARGDIWPAYRHSRQRFARSPSWISRRIASGRERWSSWDFAQRSNSRSGAGCNLTVIGVPFPVAGGPRFFRGVTI